MEGSKHFDILKSGNKAWKKWRSENPDVQPNLIKCDLRTVEFGYDASRSMTIAAFKEVDFSRTNFEHAVIRGIRFVECNFTGADFHFTDARDCEFIDCAFSHRWPEENKFDAPIVSMAGTRLEGSSFKKSNLFFVDLTGIVVDQSTCFEQADLYQATISRDVLDCMGDGGRLTVHQLKHLKVVDDIATLRREFSGYWVDAHIVAMAIFLAPYVLFVLSQMLRFEIGELQRSTGIKIVSDKESSAFGLNLINFVASGGSNWRQWKPTYFPIMMTIFAIAYNLLRLGLWLKTISLEHHKLVSGHYPTFALTGWWKTAFDWYRFFVLWGILVLLLHSLMFCFKPIPQ